MEWNRVSSPRMREIEQVIRREYVIRTCDQKAGLTRLVE